MNNSHYDNSPEAHEEGREVAVLDEQLDAHSAAEINQQIATAKRFPRSVTRFRREALELCTQDPIIAEQCTYVLPARRGSNDEIEGPSVRFAEIILACWGNIRSAARITDIGDEYIKATGLSYDLERNNAIQYEITRRITDREGRRYSADMIGTTGNAACSIALRNAILRVIPKAFWADIHDKAKACAAGGEEGGFNKKRERLMKSFAELKVSPQQIFDLMGVVGVHDLKTEHLMKLGGILTALRDGDTSVAEVFGQPQGQQQQGQGPRNEFNRQPQQQAGQSSTAPQQQTEPAQQTQQKPEPTKSAETSTKPADVKQPDPEPSTGKPSQEDALNDWIGDMRADLAKTTDVKGVNALLETVLGELGEEHALYKKFAEDAGAKTQQILRDKRAAAKKK